MIVRQAHTFNRCQIAKFADLSTQIFILLIVQCIASPFLISTCPQLTTRLPPDVLMGRVRSMFNDCRMAVTCSLVVLYMCSSTVASVLLIVRLPTLISSKGVEQLKRKPMGTGSQPHFLRLDAPAQSTLATRVILLYSLLLRSVSAPLSSHTSSQGNNRQSCSL